MNFQKVDNFANGIVGDKIPGISIIVTEGTEQIYKNSFGVSDIDSKSPMNEDVIVNFYSMTKPITCVAALQLFEQGKFLLDDPLYRYIPEFKDVVVKNENGELTPSEKPILIKDLFCMTSGYDYNLESEELCALKAKNNKMPTVEAIKALAKTPLIFTPGEKWKYGLSHDILAALVEVISGQRYSEYVRDNIFIPLGMNNSGFHKSELGKEIASQYEYNTQKGKSEKISNSCVYRFGSEYDSGGAGLISCAKDYSLFAMALANGGIGSNGNRIIGSRTLELMGRNHLTDEQIRATDYEEQKGYGYGLGVRVLVDGAKAGTNASEGEFGWNGAAGGYMLIDLKRKLSIVSVQHVLNEELGLERQNKLRNVICGCID